MAYDGGKAWPNVWLGTSVEDQPRADERIDQLAKIPAAVRFLSVEPLLGPLDLSPWIVGSRKHESVGQCNRFRPHSEQPTFCRSCNRGAAYHDAGLGGRQLIDLVIVGGESGPGARPMHPQWVRGLRDQCVSAGVPFFFKQWGEWGPAADHYTPDELATNQSPVTVVEHDGRAAMMARVGKRAAGRVLDGRTWDELPAAAGSVR